MKLTYQEIDKIYVEEYERYCNKSIDDFETFIMSRIIERCLNETELSVDEIIADVLRYQEERALVENNDTKEVATEESVESVEHESPLYEGPVFDNDVKEKRSVKDYLLLATGVAIIGVVGAALIRTFLRR